MSDGPHETPLGLAREIARNAETRNSWDLFAEHRRIVTAHLVRVGDETGSKKLCLLGAGNLNDIDLTQLATKFSAIDLLDWDEAAMRDGLARQGVAGDRRFSLCGGVDLASAGNGPLKLPRADYDAVASLCVLSQLINQLADTIGDDPPRLLDAIQELRRRHLLLILDHLRPAGLAFLVTDFVSSDTCPELLTLDVRDLPAAAERWVRDRNFFTGLNPAVLRESLLTDATLAPRCAEVQLVRPWRWQLSPRRAFAVFALKAIVR
jgi:hypothetical protein